MEPFSKDAQKVISLAESIAFHLNHSLISSEHLLLALLKEKDLPFTKELERQKIHYDFVYKRIKSLYIKKDQDPLYMEYSVELKLLLNNLQKKTLEKEEIVTPFLLAKAIIEDENCSAYELLNRFHVDLISLKKSAEKERRYTELDTILDLHPLGRNHKDPLIGRKSELNQLINALSRRNKPNAILVGEPGVGKTAICEELAYLLENDQIPSLKGKHLYELDIASTVGGTKYRGEFEEKIKKILKKVKEDQHAILFIDEIHNIVKAGGAEGAIDASNILKPYLARGEIQLIGATTEEEYEQIFEKDKPLKRRFQLIRVEESSPQETKEILRNIKDIYEAFYDTKIDDEILDEIVDLSAKYLPELAFPDKAIDILDNTLVATHHPLIKEDIYHTLSLYYKIEVEKKDTQNEIIRRLQEELFGQEEALKRIEYLLTSLKYRFKNEDSPLYSAFFLGPTGVGKSFAAEIIGEYLFGKENIIHINLSSYQDPYALSRLISPSKGTYGEEGSLFVRRLKSHPHSLILLDEVEKAGNEVLDFLLEMMDKGSFQDGKGRRVDVHNAMIIMTSNYGFDDAQLFHQKLSRSESKEGELLNKLQSRFRFEFLSRFDDIILFNYLKEDARTLIAKKYLSSLASENNIDYKDLEPYLKISEEDILRYGARIIKKSVKKALIEVEEKQKVQNVIKNC